MAVSSRFQAVSRAFFAELAGALGGLGDSCLGKLMAGVANSRLDVRSSAAARKALADMIVLGAGSATPKTD
jgi:hypothetical protein